MQENNLKKIISILVSLLFLAGIFMPFLFGIIETDEKVSKLEKRELVTLPWPFSSQEVEAVDAQKAFISTSFQALVKKYVLKLSAFPNEFNRYYADHFGFRDPFVKSYNFLKYTLGDSPSNKVTLGKDGWLFLGSIKKGTKGYGDPMGDFRNINLYSKQQLEEFTAYLEFVQAWLAKKNIKYMLLITPNKHTIYSENIPNYISKLGEYSAMDQLISHLHANSTVPVLDLRDVLLRNKQNHQLYYKTDTHWNHYATELAQYEIMQEIEKLFPNKVSPEHFEVKWDGESQKDGDLAGFIHVTSLTEEEPKPIFAAYHGPKKIIKDTATKKIHECHNPECQLNVLAYRDSFFTDLIDYFSIKFKQSTYIKDWMTFTSLDKDIKEARPDIIIEQLVERKLPYTTDSKHIKADKRFIQEKFLLSDKLIFKNQLQDLILHKDLAYRENGLQPLKLVATGADPVIHIPELPLEAGKEYIIYLNYDSSVQSSLALFYSDANELSPVFSDSRRKSTPVKVGHNEFYISLDYKHLGKSLRLDLLNDPGKIDIHSIEIREVKYLNTVR